jgi:hypothetical protein
MGKVVYISFYCWGAGLMFLNVFVMFVMASSTGSRSIELAP